MLVAVERNLIPVSCTLPPNDASSQADEWIALAADATSMEQNSSGIKLVLPERLLAHATDLAGREAMCCSFLNFDISAVTDGSFRLLLTSETEGGKSTLANMARHR